MNKMKAWQGSYGVSDYLGIVSPAYFVFNIRDVNTSYFHRAVRTKVYVPYFTRASDGVRIGQWDLSKAKMWEIPFLIPPLFEQTAIVRYLDHATDCIDRYIRAKKKLIALLEEQKQVIIHQAVTGQIDVRTGQPYLAYKDSGVEWLGKIPGCWSVKKLKHWLLVNQSTLPEGTIPSYVFDYLDIGSIGTGCLVEQPKRIRFRDSPSRARRVVRLGDTIISMVRTYLKAVWYVEKSDHDLIASTGFAVLTPKLGTWPKFVNYLCQSESFTNQVTANSVGVAYPAIAETKLGAFKVAVPPLPEQTAIARFLDKTSSRIDDAIARAQRKVELLREYRERLISDVVTGKLDVREAATRLPQESDKSASISDSDDLADSEGHDDIESTMSGTSP